MRDRAKAQALHKVKALANWSVGLYAAANTPPRAQSIMQVIKTADSVSTSIKHAAADHRAYTSSLMALYNLSGAPILRHHVEAKTDQDRMSSVVKIRVQYERDLDATTVTRDPETDVVIIDGPGLHAIMSGELHDGLIEHPDVIAYAKGKHHGN